MPLDRQPVLRGQLIELRPLRPDDFDELFAVAADPLIWEQHPASDRWQEGVFRQFFRQAIESGGALAAIDRQNGRIIGSSRFDNHDPALREVEIGWTFLARSHWGGVYNREMKELMLRHAFAAVDTVVFVVGQNNFRSQRAVEKLGALRVGSKPDAAGRPSFIYHLTASSFAHQPPV